jgi:hypothetical protein
MPLFHPLVHCSLICVLTCVRAFFTLLVHVARSRLITAMCIWSFEPPCSVGSGCILLITWSLFWVVATLVSCTTACSWWCLYHCTVPWSAVWFYPYLCLLLRVGQFVYVKCTSSRVVHIFKLRNYGLHVAIPLLQVHLCSLWFELWSMFDFCIGHFIWIHLSWIQLRRLGLTLCSFVNFHWVHITVVARQCTQAWTAATRYSLDTSSL